jgi:Fuc2NAc and GlcNAc transferase
MRIDVFLTGVGALALAAVLTGVVRRRALRHGLLDVPNERSSHTAPTPRGGGIAIVLAAGLALAILGELGAVDRSLIVALLGGGTAIAIVGFVDDRRSVPAAVRLSVHAAASLWVLIVFGGLPAIQIGDTIVHFGWGGYVLGTLAVAWVINLFNFMDGIDGIAAAEAVFVVGAGALLYGFSGSAAPAANAAIVFGMACLGFLLWNWAPASIFMGDVGSGYLGYTIAVLAIASARGNPTALLSWLILGGVFFCDATATLVRRVLRRDRVHEAHRSHAYQWLARRWCSHSRVTIAAMVVNFCWLLPCALFALRHPGLAAWTTVLAFAPVALLVLFTGAGRVET